MKNDRNQGLLYPNILAAVVMAVCFLLKNDQILGPVIVTSAFVLLPIVMGIMSAYYWQNLNLSTKGRFELSFYTILITLCMAVIVMMEGWICIIIVSPLIYIFHLTGMWIGKYLFEKRNNKLNLSVGVLIVIMFIVDMLSPHNENTLVSDQLIINAKPDKIWPYVVAYDSITQKSHYWLFEIGMPKPVATTVDGYYQGARRKCIFNGGIVFDEKMTVFNPDKELTFDIIKQPEDPELMGHIKIERGQFILKDNGNGTTTVTGNSWYSLYIYPSWYFNIWAKSITRNVHLRVMENIKATIENDDIHIRQP
jgi:hypothetical protein